MIGSIREGRERVTPDLRIPTKWVSAVAILPHRRAESKMNYLPLFEEIDQQLEADKNRIDELLKTPVDCFFCGERMNPPAIMTFNHGIVFNGWCMKALSYYWRCKGLHTEEAAWLQHNGIDPNKSQFDESHWHLENRQKHFNDHFGHCYGAGCRGLE